MSDIYSALVGVAIAVLYVAPMLAVALSSMISRRYGITTRQVGKIVKALGLPKRKIYGCLAVGTREGSTFCDRRTIWRLANDPKCNIGEVRE